MHWCGGIDDLFLIPLYILMIIPGVRYVIAKIRAKLKPVKKDCCDCHKA